MRIVLDTSFILNCVKFKIDFKSELRGHKLYIVRSVREELEELAQGRGVHGARARVGLKIISGLKLVPEPESCAGDADAVLLELSKQGYCIATQDSALKRCIISAGGCVLFIRQKRLLKFAH